MRVLCIVSVTPPAFSGATRSWMRIAPRIVENGIVLDSLYCMTTGELVLERDDGSRETIAHAWGTRQGSYFGRILTTAKVLWRERNRYGCAFFISAPDSMFVALLVKPLLGLRIVYRMTMLGEDDPLSVSIVGRFGWLRALILRGIDAAICINPAMAENSLKAGLAPARIVTIPQGTDIDQFSPPAAATKAFIRDQEAIPNRATVVLFCGAIVERKGVDLLLRAWAAICASHPNAHLLLVGPNGGDDDPDDRFLNAMRLQAASPECRKSVRFLGYREDIDDLMKAADIFVLPSRMEGTPNVLLEAMATGLAIVISDIPGVTGVFVRDGMEALVTPQNDVTCLEASLKRLIEDPILARGLGERARERAVQNYSHQHVAQQYARVFRGI